ncbi:MAG TPA: tetratricopeptide repeat protein [Candidatus Acidoferrales bacterium]|nr:tetratricopeptide repeat protein [Candidatus Acidoferrales bacterium]
MRRSSPRTGPIEGHGRILGRRKLPIERQQSFYFSFAAAVAVFSFLLCAGPVKAQTTTADAVSAQPQAATPASGLTHDTSVPGPRDLSLEKAELLVQKGLLSDAEGAVRQDLKVNPSSGAGHFLLGFILFREIQAQAERTDPNPDALYAAPGKSLVELRDANARESLAEYTAGARYQRPSAFDLKIVAMDYVLLGDFIDADKWLTRSLQWNPGDFDGWYQLGRTKYNENRFTEAVDAFKKCLARDPQDVKAEENLGLSYAGLGDDPKAISAYQTAIAWQAGSVRKDPEAYLGLGTLLLSQNHPKEAIPALIQATQIAPSVSQGHELLGKAYIQANDLSKAQSELEEAVKLSPEIARLHYVLGQVYRKEGLTAKAKAEFDRCAALQGTRSSDSSTM